MPKLGPSGLQCISIATIVFALILRTVLGYFNYTFTVRKESEFSEIGILLMEQKFSKLFLKIEELRN
jgi:hypothetical protein